MLTSGTTAVIAAFAVGTATTRSGRTLGTVGSATRAANVVARIRCRTDARARRAAPTADNPTRSTMVILTMSARSITWSFPYGRD